MTKTLKKELSRVHRMVYRPTLDDLYFWFDIINEEVFDGILPKTRFTQQRRFRGDGQWAWTVEDENDKVFFMFIKRFPNLRFFLNVLAHEMVHLWEETILKEDCDHGPAFMSWKDKFREHGLKLEKAY